MKVSFIKVQIIQIIDFSILTAKVHDKSDNGATEVTDSVGSSSGEFPTIFYNNIGGSSKNTLIL